jgi:ABC-type dipeptide/oligopeptide/nickel transport system ATPase component
MPPDPAQKPPGCPFAPRCPRRSAVCETSFPAWTRHPGGGGFACYHPLEAGHG